MIASEVDLHARSELQKTLALIVFPPLTVLLLLFLPFGGSYNSNPSKADTIVFFFGFLNIYWVFDNCTTWWIYASTVSITTWWYSFVYILSFQSLPNFILLLNVDLNALLSNMTPFPIISFVITFSFFAFFDRHYPRKFYFTGISQRLIYILTIMFIYSLTFSLCQLLTQHFQDQNQATQFILIAAYQTSFFILRYVLKYLSSFVSPVLIADSESYVTLNSSPIEVHKTRNHTIEIRGLFIFPIHLFQYTFSRVLGTESSWLIFILTQIIHALLEYLYFHDLKQDIFRYQELFLRACATILTSLTYICFIECAYGFPWLGQGIFDLDHILILSTAENVHIGTCKTFIAGVVELLVLVWAYSTQTIRSSSVFMDKFLMVLFFAIHTQTDLVLGLSTGQLERTSLH